MNKTCQGSPVFFQPHPILLHHPSWSLVNKKGKKNIGEYEHNKSLNFSPHLECVTNLVFLGATCCSCSPVYPPKTKG